MTLEQVTNAIALTEAGRLVVQALPPYRQYSHDSCIRPIYPAEGWTETYHKAAHLARALDCALWQSRRRGDTRPDCVRVLKRY